MRDRPAARERRPLEVVWRDVGVDPAVAADYRAGRIGYGGAKKQLRAKIDALFSPFRDKRKELARNPDMVEDILRDGARRARVEAEKTMELVREDGPEVGCKLTWPLL